MPKNKDDFDQLDLFCLDIVDASPKSDQISMEFPIFSLSKKKDMREFTFKNRNNEYTVVPSGRGRANMYDKDILIYCGSQIVAAMRQGKVPSRKVRMPVYDFLKVTGSSTGDGSYKSIEDRLVRLSGTQVIWRQGMPDGFVKSQPISIIDDWQVVVKDGQKLVGEVDILLSEWIYDAYIGLSKILTLNHGYFKLKPIEKRMYELSRKHCGYKDYWEINFNDWFGKLGSYESQKRKHKFNLSNAGLWPVLDYALSLDKERNMVTVMRLSHDKEDEKEEESKEPEQKESEDRWPNPLDDIPESPEF